MFFILAIDNSEIDFCLLVGSITKKLILDGYRFERSRLAFIFCFALFSGIRSFNIFEHIFCSITIFDNISTKLTKKMQFSGTLSFITHETAIHRIEQH